MTFEIADYDPSIAPADLAAIWFASWAANNPDLARGQTAAPLIDHAARDLANGRWQVRVARRDGVLVAFAALVPAEARLEQLFVLPEAQGYGIGSALLRDAMQRHPGGLKLRTQATNIDGLRFYARHGFVETQRMPHETRGLEMVWLRWPA